MAFDALLSSTGPAGAAGIGNAIEAGNVTADAAGSKGWVFFGKHRAGVMEGRLTGAFDRTTGDETLTFQVREATDAAGSGAAVIATGSAQTASHAGALASGTLSSGPVRLGFMTGSGGYIQAYFDVAGTTPIATGVSADFIPTADAFRPSGI